MFEKEAKEYMHKDGTEAEKLLNTIDLSLTKRQVFVLINMCKQIFKDGAEFGYKKGQSDQLVHKQYQLNQLRKANEWHYVKDEGTPTKEGHYLVCLRNKDHDIFDCWIYYDKDVGWYSMKVRMKDIYAWKEIVPPSLDKEKANETE